MDREQAHRELSMWQALSSRELELARIVDHGPDDSDRDMETIAWCVATVYRELCQMERPPGVMFLSAACWNESWQMLAHNVGKIKLLAEGKVNWPGSVATATAVAAIILHELHARQKWGDKYPDPAKGVHGQDVAMPQPNQEACGAMFGVETFRKDVEGAQVSLVGGSSPMEDGVAIYVTVPEMQQKLGVDRLQVVLTNQESCKYLVAQIWAKMEEMWGPAL